MMLRGRSPYKVYVMLGFHTSFYHSWRGDTPDEAGFGTDIRIVRQILQILDGAASSNRQARGYWDFDVYWTLERILPAYAPDIIDAIRRRVQSGLDDVVLGPYNNGANHAATERELRTAVAYAIENPFGSGLRQVFGRTSTILRPQEGMLTAGQSQIYLEEGVTGLVLYYAGVPFNCLSTFVPNLPPEQRYGLSWLRCQPDEPPVELWPCISLPDLLEETCLEALLLKLRRLQNAGQVESDLLVHINFDADGEPWLPVEVPRAFRWFPNTGGLQEYVDVVNRYDWAQFTIPSEYRQDHAPSGEVLVRQDLADGAFDGNYSWAEKYTSLLNWTELERSRLHTYRAEALLHGVPDSLAREFRQRLWEGPESAFFRRLVGLSTTHFGMSTPVINQERQAKASELLSDARSETAEAERAIAGSLREVAVAAGRGAVFTERQDTRPRRRQSHPFEASGSTLYKLEVYRPAIGWAQQEGAVRSIFRLPVVLPPEVTGFRLLDGQGDPLRASLVDGQRLTDGCLAGDLVFTATLDSGERRSYQLLSGPGRDEATKLDPLLDGRPGRLHNRWLELCLSEDTGIASLRFEGQQIGSADLLSPFITYLSGRRPQRWLASSYTIESLVDETWDGLARARISTEISMDTQHGPAVTKLQYTFTLCDNLPYLLVDVTVEYARTPPEDTIQTLQQKLRRLLDLRWIEVAPFQLNPLITARADRPLRIWKHNYHGVTTCYDLDYRLVNPRNAELDSFNHQVTAGWLAVTNGEVGLLLAENAEVLSSMAFCPMRLRERAGTQYLSLNPFGSYHGGQLDYSHLGGNRVGAELTTAASGALRPNGPSYNGQRLAFSLLMAPYRGDAPPAQLQSDALAHFYPAGAVYKQVPDMLDVVVSEDVRRHVAADEAKRRCSDGEPLPAPWALLANPSDRAVELVWEVQRDVRVTGLEARWREEGDSGWQYQRIEDDPHWQLSGLRNGQRYQFQLRSVGLRESSDWTAVVEAEPGPIQAPSLLSMLPAVSLSTLVRMVGHSLAHVLRTRLTRKPA